MGRVIVFLFLVPLGADAACGSKAGSGSPGSGGHGGTGGDTGSGGVQADAMSSSIGNWVLAASGLPSDAVVALAVDRSDASTVYAGFVSLADETAGSGVYKTTDAGANWSAANGGITQNGLGSYGGVYELTFDAAQQPALYAGTWGPVWKSTDGGGSWTQAATNGPVQDGSSPIAVAVDPTNPAVWYLGGHRGLWSTADSGTTWNDLLPAPDYPNTRWIRVDPQHASNAYACTSKGFYRITNQAQLTEVSNEVFCVGASSADFDVAGALYVGSPSETLDAGEPSHLRVSRDGGNTWTEASAGLGNPSLVGVVVADPTRAGTLYAIAGSNVDGGTFVPVSGRLFKTTDGATWQDAHGDLPDTLSSVAIAPSDPNTVYVGTIDGRVYRSVVGGG